MKPRRIQRKRSKGWRMPANTVYVGRPTKFGNPYRAGMFRNFTRSDAVESYEHWLTLHPEVRHSAMAELRGKNLACYCPLHCRCHADVLLQIANQ